ncbi:GH39 family glycosyl hydrolase [Larkinella punicea]|uniref:Glycosyl hydrolases family 39 N-terminal catalytic domain-containing protein n=1 Tax=Larkinella punicea TaxID=2315727 RepID=A0A368JT25_9BACT|nr:hypothetical protein [Larkinella punicea]RCR70602.1 hypothetical protein DUE52_06545 [Larkinella punicea]
MKFLTPFLLSISLISVELPTASAQNPAPGLTVLEPKGFREVAQLRPRSTKEIKSSTWSIGGETLDRDYTDYQSYRHYLGPLGAKRIRLQGGWSKCEKVKGQYDFAWLDAVIPDAYSRGVSPWVELSYGNPIYPGGGEPKLGGRIPTSEEALVAWDNWVRAMVNRYKNQVTEWEIWNEPDLNKLNTGEEVAVFYIRTAKLVKAIQPNAKLIALGVAGVPATAFMRPFLDHLKKENALDLVDILTYHGYAPNPDTSYPKIEEMRKLVWSYNRSAGRPKITFMQGENGAPSTASAVTIGALRQYDWTELSQAKWDLRRMLADHGRGIATNLFTISDIHYAAGDHMTGVNTKGLLKTNPDKTIERPKMAYKAAQHVFSTFDDQLELLDQAKPTVSQATVSAFQYRQRKNSGSLVTLWSAEARPAETYEPKPTDVTIKGKFDQPVFVDLVSGKVYEIPKNQWKKSGDSYTFTAIPVPDYPVLIAEKTALHLLTPTGQSANPSFKYLGKIAPKNSRDIQSSNWSVGAEYMDRDYTVYVNWKDYLGKLGVKKARIQSGWAKCEKVKGHYDFAWLDEIVFDMVKQGVTPWIDLCYGNPLYSGGGGTTLNAAIPFSGEALAGWKNYVAAVVARYGDKVTEWEIWNEPNYKISIPDYADFFITTAETVRSVQPKAQIIAFAPGSGVDYKFADSALKIIQEKGKLGLINQISHHRHIPNPDNRDSEVELEKVVAKYSPAIRIRQGEAGCPSEWNNNFALNKYPWTELTQSKHILRRLLTDLGHDKESCCFTIMDAKTPQEWNHKGLLKANEDLTVAHAKPAYYAFQNLISVFDDKLERLETYPYSVKKEENNTLSLYAYADKANQLQAVTVWIKDNVPSDNNEQTLCDFTFANARFKNPVWVDLIAGTVYEIPKENWSKKENVFRQIPLYDSPILIADKSLINLSVNQ